MFAKNLPRSSPVHATNSHNHRADLSHPETEPKLTGHTITWMGFPSEVGRLRPGSEAELWTQRGAARAERSCDFTHAVSTPRRPHNAHLHFPRPLASTNELMLHARTCATVPLPLARTHKHTHTYAKSSATRSTPPAIMQEVLEAETLACHGKGRGE